MERISGSPGPHRVTSTALTGAAPAVNSPAVAGLLGAQATRHILYLLEGQYLYQSQAEDGPISYKFLSAQSVRLAFSQEPVDSGWLSPAVCRWGYSQGGQWAVMFIPPARYSLQLSGHVPYPDAKGNGLEPLQNGPVAMEREGHGEPPASPVPLPGLVMAAAGQNYYLWAVKAREFSPQLPVYQAPLPNVYHDGRICWGTNRVATATAQNLPAAWQLFISSPFNLHLAQGKSKRFSENILPQLNRLAGAGSKTYPARDLVPLQSGWDHRAAWTVDRRVERLIAGSSN